MTIHKKEEQIMGPTARVALFTNTDRVRNALNKLGVGANVTPKYVAEISKVSHKRVKSILSRLHSKMDIKREKVGDKNNEPVYQIHSELKITGGRPPASSGGSKTGLVSDMEPDDSLKTVFLPDKPYRLVDGFPDPYELFQPAGFSLVNHKIRIAKSIPGGKPHQDETLGVNVNPTIKYDFNPNSFKDDARVAYQILTYVQNNYVLGRGWQSVIRWFTLQHNQSHDAYTFVFENSLDPKRFVCKLLNGKEVRSQQSDQIHEVTEPLGVNPCIIEANTKIGITLTCVPIPKPKPRKEK